MNSNKRVILHLSLIPGVGPASLLKIVCSILGICNDLQKLRFKINDVDFSQLYSFGANDFMEKCFLPKIYADRVVEGLKNKKSLNEEEKLIAKYKIDFLTFFDEAYPKELLNIFVPPPVLYCQGTPLQIKQDSIAVVGSRKAGAYAQKVVDSLIVPLSQQGWTIVSGGALGVDSMAHRAALECGGATIVILGSGLLLPYPSQNKDLFASVIDHGGTLISIFPLRSKPLSGNFPARNRVIAGLASGCLIVAAAKKSGAKITAHYALEQGKHVFAVPGSIFNELYEGCHDLILQGAKLVSSINDILEEFGKEYILEDDLNANKPRQENAVKNQVYENQDKNIEDPLLAAILKPTSIDELAVKVGMPIFEIQQRLFDLQLEGKVKQNFIGYWERV